MSWQIALQTFSASLAAIGAWFIWDLVREFKIFKNETRTDVANLKVERISFLNTVRQAELSIGHRVNDIQKIHNGFSLEVGKSLNEINLEIKTMRSLISSATDKAQNFEEFLQKCLQLSKNLHDRIRKTEHELQSLKIELGDLMIIKGEKKSP